MTVHGYYLILRAVNHNRPGEATNIGCAVYASDGHQIGSRADTLDRAVMRGDLSADRAEALKDYASTILRSHKTMASVQQAHRSTGHAMSSIQLGDLNVTLIKPNTVDDIFERYVIGNAK